MSESDNDISWLTQQPSMEGDTPSFDIGMSYIEEELCSQDDNDGLISLEEQPCYSQGRCVLYDNVMCEDISSDEELDKM